MRKKLLKLEFGYPDRADLFSKMRKLETGSVEEIKISEIFQYVPGHERVRWMEELYRVLAPEGRVVILTNYYSSAMGVADFEVAWPPLCEQSFLFFNKKWREQNNLANGMACDFDFNYGFVWAPDVVARSVEVQAEWAKSKLNAVQKIQVTLSKVKP